MSEAIWAIVLTLAGVLDDTDFELFAPPFASAIGDDVQWLLPQLLAGRQHFYLESTRGPDIPPRIAEICEAFCLSMRWHSRKQGPGTLGEIRIIDREVGLTGHFPLTAEGDLDPEAEIPPEWLPHIARWRNQDAMPPVTRYLDPEALPPLVRLRSAHELVRLLTRPETAVTARACMARRAARAQKGA